MTVVTRRHRSRGVRRAPAPELTIAQIRLLLDEPTLSSDTWADLPPLRPGVQVDRVKDKIAENLPELVNHPTLFQREWLLRKDCDRQAGALRQASFLRRSDRTRDLWTGIRSEYKLLKRRTRGVESRGQLAVILHFRKRHTDRGYVYGHTLLCLYAILRHVTTPARNRDVLFDTIASVLQAVGVLRNDGKNPGAAIQRAFDRANRWPPDVNGPPPVDFTEDFLFALEGRGPHPRFPPQPPVLDSRYYSTVRRPADLPPQEVTPAR